jgi:glucosamine-6-phosphate deaminase
MDFLSTLPGSYAGPFYPQGWDYRKIDKITGYDLAATQKRQPHWHKNFDVEICNDSSGGVEAMNAKMGYEIFCQIREADETKRELAMILPVGPMGMYQWVVYFCRKHNVSCKHVHGFNMDEWSDQEGNSTPPDAPGSFQGAMEQALYGPLDQLTVPKNQRNFATRKLLPEYPEKIAALRKAGAKLVVVYGIGRACHIAFWEPHFAAEYKSTEEWRQIPYRLAAQLHPLTIEQNSLHTFASRLTMIPLRANTIGPGLFTKADYCIGGADGCQGNFNWQGQSVRMTLHYGPDPWVPSSWMPTMPGRLFVIQSVAGPLMPEAH